MNHSKKNLSLRSFETGNLSADNFKKYSTSTGRHLSPRYGQVILVSGYPVLTAVDWSQHWCAISFLLGSQTTVASKCESKHWLPCGEDGRTGVRSRDYQISWVGRLPHFLSYGAKREARAWAELRYNAICGLVIEFIHSSHHGFSRGRSCTTSLGWEWWLS